jgi:hypothetical protein
MVEKRLSTFAACSMSISDAGDGFLGRERTNMIVCMEWYCIEETSGGMTDRREGYTIDRGQTRK